MRVILIVILLLVKTTVVFAQDLWDLKILSPHASTYWKLQNIQRLVDYYAEKDDIDQTRWYTLIELESKWNRFAISKKGATGICQIWPPTARSYGLEGNTKQIIKQLKNPAVNIRLCAQILRDLLDRYNGDWFNVAVAFNAGPGVVTYAQKISQSGNRIAKN